MSTPERLIESTRELLWERFAGLRATGPLAAHFAPVENSLLRKVWPYPREVPDFARPGRTSRGNRRIPFPPIRGAGRAAHPDTNNACPLKFPAEGLVAPAENGEASDGGSVERLLRRQPACKPGSVGPQRLPATT